MAPVRGSICISVRTNLRDPPAEHRHGLAIVGANSQPWPRARRPSPMDSRPRSPDFAGLSRRSDRRSESPAKRITAANVDRERSTKPDALSTGSTSGDMLHELADQLVGRSSEVDLPALERNPW